MSEIDFKTVWERAGMTPGWLKEHEAQLLYSALMQVPHDRCVVEVGTYRGRSTRVLANGRTLVAIDPDPEAGEAIKGIPNVRFECRRATECTPPDNIGLLFIDGDHSGRQPLKDFRHFQKHLAPGAIVAFHDFLNEVGVTEAVAQLEREGTIDQLEAAGSMYVGQVVSRAPWRYRVLLARPRYDRVDSKAYISEKHTVFAQSGVQVHLLPAETSLLAHGFNDCVVECLRRRAYDFYAMVHDDVSCSPGYVSVLIEEAESHGLDVLHAVVPIKNSTGLTSTAIAYSDDPWQVVRRLTMTELSKLPKTFDIETIRAQLDAKASHLLPNTGCLLVRTEVLHDFPGFQICDRIRRTDDDWVSECVPEDWNFGHWCHRQGLRVGGTKAVRIQHWGRQGFPNDRVWGADIDDNWVKKSR